MNHLEKIIAAYVPLALRTELNPKGIKGKALVSRRLLHAALGVGTEVAELSSAVDVVNFLEEAADSAWYLALATDLLSTKGLHVKINEHVVLHSNNATKETNLLHLVRLSGDFLDFAKRDHFYLREPDWNAVQFTVQELWQATFKAILLRGGDIQTCLDANIDKLKSRYPEKFTCELAVQRNVKQERKVLEQHMGKS